MWRGFRYLHRRKRALSIYRLVQEALTNAIKYAGARHLVVSLGQAGDTVVVTVADDGRGFDPAARGGSGHGLAGMRFRIRSGGGQMQVESAPGRGTTIRASLPVSD